MFLYFSDQIKPLQKGKSAESTTRQLSSYASQKFNHIYFLEKKSDYNRAKVRSELADSVLPMVCIFLECYLSEKFIHVWFGYKNKKEPVFVAIVKTKMSKLMTSLNNNLRFL